MKLNKNKMESENVFLRICRENSQIIGKYKNNISN